MKRRSALLILVALFSTQPALADVCLPEGNGNTCTAKDFTLTESLVDGPASCTEGENIPGGITLRVGMEPTANERYNIGVFVGDEGASPIGGPSCTFSSLSPIEPPAFNGLSGSGPYRDLDGDACGDTAKSDGEVFHDVALADVLCKDENNDGKLDLAFALTWAQSGGSCADPNDADEFLGGTSSKCVEWIGDIDEIIVVPPQPDIPIIDVTKTAFPNIIHPGEEVTYSVSVINEGVVPVTLTSLLDDKFGNLDGAGTCNMPKTIDSGNTYNCTFINTLPTKTASLHTNTVTASAFYEATMVEDSDSATVEVIGTSTAAIGQVVWQDLNGDGISQENEPGIDGVTIDLKNGSGVVIDTATTSQGGEYTFLSLLAGSYQVKVTDMGGVLSGMVLTGGVDPHNVTLGDGQIYTDANFGYARASISVSKEATPSVVHAPGDLVRYTIRVANTGPIDVLIFELVDTKFGLLHGVGTCVDFLATPELVAAGDSYQCAFDKTISGAAGTSHSNTAIALAGDFNNHVLFGADDALVQITDSNSAAVGDLVWFDMNGNGIVDTDEPGIDGVTLELWYDSAGDGVYEALIEEQTTLNNGYYNFTSLAAGAYQVRVTDINNALLGMILTGGFEPHSVTLSSGELYGSANFGYNAEPLPEIETLKTAVPSVVAAPGGNVTFTVEINNIGDTDVVIEQMLDDRFGDLNGLGDCALLEDIVVGATYSCSFTANITGSPGDEHTNNIQTSAVDINGHTAHARSTAVVQFIDPASSAIGDQLWHDINANGVFDTGEPGIPNVSLDLTLGGSVVATTITDSSGIYNFTNLAANTYQVEVTDVSNVLADAVLTGGLDPHLVNLAAGTIYADADFGYGKALIEVLKDGTPAVIYAPGEPVAYTVTVTNQGFLSVTLATLVDDIFGDLNGQGTCATPQPLAVGENYNCTFSENIAGIAGDLHSNIVTATATDTDGNTVEDDASFTVTIVEDVPSQNSAIGLGVWNDENGDGVKQSEEPGLGSVTIELVLDSDINGDYETVIGSRTTLTNGVYLFTGLVPGNYQVNVTDDFGVISAMDLTGGTEPHLLTLAEDELYLKANFGYQRPNSPPSTPISIIGVLVWDDENADGMKDSTESGLASVTLDLMRDTNIDGSFETIVASTTTQVEGYYVFRRLPAGEYQVRVTDDNGIVSRSTLTGGVEPHPVILADKELYPDANFGYFTPPDARPAAAIPTLPLYLLSVLAGLITLLAVVVIRVLNN